MKYTKYIWGLVAAMLFAACQSDEIAPTNPEKQIGGQTMPVRLHYTLDDQTLVTRASIVSGTEKPITSIKMLCFNQADAFLGCFDANLTPETDFTGIIEGEVNSNTTKVHFIANHPDLQVSLSSNYLRDMHDVIQDKVLTLAYDENNDGNGGKCMTYWTYHAESTPQQMADFLSPPQGSEDKYIHFVRDRVKIEATEITSEVMSNSKVSSVRWMVTDGLTKGYVIPWRTFEGGTDFIGTDINADFFNATVGSGNTAVPYGNIKITPYEKNNRQRYTNVEANFETFNASSALYVFEDYNNGTYNGSVTETLNRGMVRLIFEVTYTNGHKKYHVIKLSDSKDAPYQLKRNHNYRVTINSLSETQAALPSFEDALETDQFSNDQFASVADIVPSVSGAANTLTIVGKTSKILNTGNTTGGTNNRQYTVYFTLKDGDGNGISAPNYNLIYDGMDASFGTVVSSAYNSSTGEGRVTIQLAQAIPGSGQAPNTGRLRIYDSVSRLYRYVLFYAVEEFVYPTGGTPVMTHASGTNFNSTYNLTFTIPANYPEGLYPITLVIGTRTLTPTAITRAANTEIEAATLEGSFAVDVESTGASGWNYTAGSSPWNSNANNWNYVYKFKILEKPVNKNSDTGEYSTQDATYTITFRDDRQKINAANTDDVGLFFEVENFGNHSQYQVYGHNNTYTSTQSFNN